MANREAKKLNQSCQAGQRTHLYVEPSMTLEMSDRKISGSDIVSMMQTAEPRHGNSFCIQCCVLLGFSLSRRLLAQSEMRPVLVVVVDIIIHESFQVALVENDDVIEQIAGGGPVPMTVPNHYDGAPVPRF